MLLTRSIRRKLLTLLTVLLIMLATLTLASLTGLAGYKRVVRELDLTIRTAPRSSDLTASLAGLIEPLSAELPPVRSVDEPSRLAAERLVLQAQKQHFRDALDEVDTEVAEYFARVAELPADTGTGRRNREVHDRLQSQLRDLRGASETLGSIDRRAETVAWIGRRLTQLVETAERAPRPSDGLIARLRMAENDYRAHVRMVRFASAASIAVLAGLCWLTYRWVVVPVRKLAAGARAVAAGRYETRIHLVSDDEMAELAATFNRMTERFQTVMAEQHQEIKLRSQQLIQSARLADVGFLAAGIAHEVNNPLAAIGMAAESLEWRLSEVAVQAREGGASDDDVDGVLQYLQMIQSEAARVRDLTGRMLDFARRSPESDAKDRNLYDVTAIVAEVLEMVGHLKRYSDRQIAWTPGPEPLRASVNASQVKQVILNLVTNALEAMEPGGTLRIGLEARCDVVELTFCDDGCGMTPETAEHIFDPFFTTKAGGSSGTAGTGGESLADGNAAHTGTGLGLSISHRIVEDHQGSLRAESDGPGEGSTFTLRLPRESPAVRLAA